MWGHPMLVLGALCSFLEPFCGHSSPKIDKVSEELTLRYPHEGPWVGSTAPGLHRRGSGARSAACGAWPLHLSAGAHPDVQSKDNQRAWLKYSAWPLRLSAREIGNLLPNNRRQRRTCYALCHILYPVSAAHTSIFRMDSNSTYYPFLVLVCHSFQG